MRCIFNASTNIGIGINREALAGEYLVEIAETALADFFRHPSRYVHLSGSVVERHEWQQEEAAAEAIQNAAIAALGERIAAIEVEQEAQGMKTYTPQQAVDYITNKLTNAPNTFPGVKLAVGEILIKMVPYILPK